MYIKKINVKNLNINLSNSVSVIRQCFFIYLVLLIFEGAFRKWFLPEISDLFLIVRDPFALYVLIAGVQRGLLKDTWGEFFIIITLISFCVTLVFGHQNLLVALYGARIYGLHLPCAFIWSKVLTRNELLIAGKFVLYVSILMTIIMGFQYFSPQSSWINRGIGGDLKGSGFSGAGGYYRPSGTFSFISGIIGFEFLVASYILYFFLQKSDYHISKIFLYIVTVFFISSIFLSLSRSVIASIMILYVWCAIFLLTDKQFFLKIILGSVFIVLLTILLYNNSSIIQVAVDTLLLRFDSASNAEGDFIKGSMGNRAGGSFLRAFIDTQNFSNKEIPFWGFGMGAGSKVGATLLNMLSPKKFALAEEEWSLVINEYGYFIGSIILLVGRAIFPLSQIKSVLAKRNQGDWFAFAFFPFFVVSLTYYQLSPPTLLGFCVVATTIFLCALNTNQIKEYDN